MLTYKNQILLSDGLMAAREEQSMLRTAQKALDSAVSTGNIHACKVLACAACSEAHRLSEAHLEIGKIRHKQRDYRRAAAELQTAVDLNPESKQARSFGPGPCCCSW